MIAAVRRGRPGALGVLVALLVLAFAPGARAGTTQLTILVDDRAVLLHPQATLQMAQALGVTVLRLDVRWADVAPQPSAMRPPRFDATDPAAYPAGAWAPYDTAIRDAAALGITVDLDPGPGAPRWATGPGQPHDAGYPHLQWEPDPVAFGRFVQALGTRYGGDWDPTTNRAAPGDPGDLPRVDFWSVWNEPNYGPSLAPQGLPGHPGVPASPARYRALVDGAWTGLNRGGHHVPGDTFLVGELAPRSELTEPGHFRDFNGMTPIVFLESLFCLDGHDRPLTGDLAALQGCPTSPGPRRRFAAAHPGLFDASGVADHPYDEWFAPDQELDVPRLRGWAQENRQDTSLATIDNLPRALDRLTAADGVREHLPIYDTEYGYQTDPPHRRWAGDHRPWPSPARAAFYDNWAEYLHWRDPRIRSFCQYLLEDGAVPTPQNDFGAFPSGLLDYRGRAKADFYAFRMPLYLPRTHAASGRQALEIWGAVRPVTALLAIPAGAGAGLAPTPGRTTQVELRFRPAGQRTFRHLAWVPVGPGGYYDVHRPVPTSGTLMARWSVPRGALVGLTAATIASRQVDVTVR